MARRLWVLSCVALSLAILTAVPALAASDSATAKAILEASGVKTGLAFHLGCGRTGSAGLTAALAEQGLVVHGLALDQAACARARKAIDARNVAGRAMVECVPVKPLPYLDNLANLIVTEDLTELRKHGVTREEILRVLAPGGIVCSYTGGGWPVYGKARPAEMDDWTHPQHGADGNMVSADKVFQFPIGLKWIDGVPMNLVRWAGVRGWVVAKGRCFTLSSTELENIGLKVKPHYLVARDAWNGLPLWKINCETTDDGSYLTWENAGPLAADDARVYAVKKDKVIAADAATGKVVYTCPNAFTPYRILVSDGVLVTSCWKERDFSRATWNRFDKKNDSPSLWATWMAKGGAGAVEAYDAPTGKVKWTLPFAAETIVAADGVLYALRQKGNPPTERELVAVTLADGKERWAVSSAKFGPEADFQLNTAGAGYVVVVRRAKNQLLVFSPKDGSVLWKLPSGASPWTPVVDGALWVGGQKYDPRTGAVKGRLARGIGNQGCTPSTLVNNILTQSRGCGYVELPPENDPEQGKVKSLKYGGARGGCMQGMAPANGMFYTCQNNCRCAPGHVYGFLGLAPSGAWPTAEDFGKARPVEKGPAFGAVDAISVGVADWPLFLGDAERSSGARTQLPEGLKQVWIAKVASAGEGMLGTAWRSRLESPLSAPVAAYGKVFAAKTDAGQVAAFDAATGKPAWTYSAGARIDTPPTLYRGLCIFGAHDGWVYALRAKDGALVWRTRVAPWERRMVAYGQVESVWPAIGTVLVHEGVLYANAGRTSESDGGIAVVALDPASGKMLWGSAIAPGPGRQTDLLRVVDGKVQWHHVPLDPKTGAVDRSTKPSKGASQGGLMDGTWTILGKRRAGRAFTKGKVQDDLLAWNADLILTPRQAIPQATPTADPTGLAEPKPKAKGWAVGLPGGSKVDALAIAQNATASAGRAAAGSFLRVNAAADGKKLAELSLPAAPTFAGIAIAEGRIFVTLQDGSLLCFGK